MDFQSIVERFFVTFCCQDKKVNKKESITEDSLQSAKGSDALKKKAETFGSSVEEMHGGHRS